MKTYRKYQRLLLSLHALYSRICVHAQHTHTRTPQNWRRFLLGDLNDLNKYHFGVCVCCIVRQNTINISNILYVTWHYVEWTTTKKKGWTRESSWKSSCNFLHNTCAGQTRPRYADIPTGPAISAQFNSGYCSALRSIGHRSVTLLTYTW